MEASTGMSTHLINELQRRMTALKTNPTALSKKAKLNQTAVRDILEGTRPRVDTLQKLAKALGCAVADLTGERPAARQSQLALDAAISVNELDVHATSGMGADEASNIMVASEAHSVTGVYTFPQSGFKEAYGAQPQGVRIVPVRGDSMTPTLWPGQRVMVDTSDRVPSPPGVFVIWDGLALVLKRVELIPGSDPPSVRLTSDNPKYKDYERTIDEAHINGRVIGVWARM